MCDEHSDYKDAKLLYRFRKDDGTFPLNKDVKVFVRGQSLYEKCVSPSLPPGEGCARCCCCCFAAGTRSHSELRYFFSVPRAAALGNDVF